MKRRTFLKALVGAAGAVVAGAAFTAEAQATPSRPLTLANIEAGRRAMLRDGGVLFVHNEPRYGILCDRPPGGIKVELIGKETA